MAAASTWPMATVSWPALNVVCRLSNTATLRQSASTASFVTARLLATAVFRFATSCSAVRRRVAADAPTSSSALAPAARARVLRRKLLRSSTSGSSRASRAARAMRRYNSASHMPAAVSGYGGRAPPAALGIRNLRQRHAEPLDQSRSHGAVVKQGARRPESSDVKFEHDGPFLDRQGVRIVDHARRLNSWRRRTVKRESTVRSPSDSLSVAARSMSVGPNSRAK